MASWVNSHNPLFRPVAIAPTYNNARTVGDILRRLADMSVIAINDGSTDGTRDILSEWERGNRQERRVLMHERNRGKAAALLSGFAAAMELGFTHAVTMDTDGQLQPEDVPVLLAKAQANPGALVIGTRDVSAADYPARSRLGRRLSNWMIRLECGLKVSDSQCGLRVYPLAMVRAIQCTSGHFGFETEIITRAVWAGFKVVDAPVRCTYGPADQRVSHFKPCRDTLRGLWMHARLLPLSLAQEGVDQRVLESQRWPLNGERAAATAEGEP